MFIEIDECKNQRDTKENGIRDANAAANLDGFSWMPAPCYVEERAVREDVGGRIWGKSQKTPRAVGKGTIGIVRVIPMPKGRKVEVDVVNDSIGEVPGIAGRKAEGFTGC